MYKNDESRYFPQFVSHAVLTDLLNKFVVIAIIDVYSNENRPRSIKRLFEYEVSAGV